MARRSKRELERALEDLTTDSKSVADVDLTERQAKAIREYSSPCNSVDSVDDLDDELKTALLDYVESRDY